MVAGKQVEAGWKSSDPGDLPMHAEGINERGMKNFYACFSNANRLAFFYAPLNGQPKGRQSAL